MAFYRSRRKLPREDPPDLAAVERELDRYDRRNLKRLVVVALVISVGLWIIVKTRSDVVVTDAQPPAPHIEQTTTGAGVPQVPDRTDTPSFPKDRVPETPVQPKGPYPTEQ